MFDLDTIKHMNKPAQVAKSRKLALAMNAPDTQKSRQCDHTRKTPPVCGHGKCFDKWNRAVGVLLLFCALVLSTGCTKKAQSESPTSNAKFKIELLFEHDGVKVYRFFDGREVYYTDARGATAWQESCGKHSSRPVRVETVR